jgi:hypothetical protein
LVKVEPMPDVLLEQIPSQPLDEDAAVVFVRRWFEYPGSRNRQRRDLHVAS